MKNSKPRKISIKMSKFGAKTYSRRPELKSNVQFDQLFSDKKNKPSTAKVSAGVQRWGVATFTSLRKTPLNGQKEHEDEDSKRFKMDAPVEKTISKPILVEDPFSFDLDKDSSPIKNVMKTAKSSTVLPVVEKKTKQSYTRPNKFFKSSAKNLAAHNNPQFNPALVLEKTFCYDKLGIVEPLDVLTTQPTVVKLLSPTKTTAEEKQDVPKPDIAKPSAFDLLLATNSSAAVQENTTNTNKKVLPRRTDDWFSVFDNCNADDQPQSDADELNVNTGLSLSGKSSPEVEIISESTESDKLGFREKTRSSESHTDLFSVTTARTYLRSRSKIPETCEKDTVCDLSQSAELNSSFQHQDTPSRSHSFSQTLDFEDREFKQRTSETVGEDIVIASDSATPSSSQEVSSPEKQDSTNGKKGTRSRMSIFKSRNSQNKKKVVYKHRLWQEDDQEEIKLAKDSEKPNLSEEFEDEIEKPDFTLMKKVTQKVSYSSRETITSWKCDKKAKELYTVVHNVKQAYQCHESGETQEFNDEVEYLLEGIQPKSSLGTRCLSVVGWATKCMLPSFRIHLRAHGTIPRVFSALMDAPKDSSLSLCTATLMFVLSQDRLTMDLEANTLSLMLQLLEASPSDVLDSPCDSPQPGIGSASETISFQQASKMKEKVRQLCEEMQQKGYAKQLNLEHITTGNLAMETLLSLTSRKAGEWFKEGIRNLGGLDYIVDAVNSCSEIYCSHKRPDNHPSDTDLSELKKIDRCLRVLENVTYMNADNQTYLLQYKKAIVVSCCFSMLQACRLNIAHNPVPHDGSEKPSSKVSGNLPGFVLLNCILSLLKVLLNLTHESANGSSIVGSREGLLECILLCILQVPQFIPPEDRFDLLVLALGLLINMMEKCEENRHRIAFVHTYGSYDSPNCGEELSALEALVEVFLGRVEAAKQSEEQADALLDAKEKPADASKSKDNGEKSTPSSSQQSQAEELEETLMKALQKAGKNMEHSIIAAYIALLLGCIIQNKDYADLVRDHMPNGNFNAMVEMLRKFLNFVSLTGVVGTTGLKSIQKVLQVLESS